MFKLVKYPDFYVVDEITDLSKIVTDSGLNWHMGLCVLRNTSHTDSENYSNFGSSTTTAVQG